ncbi:MAG TPA: hypothetical protein VJX67_23905, partial [Blastocatellia bacterium]|nr:hypothetical protein [Blastocatellia bacterium]
MAKLAASSAQRSGKTRTGASRKAGSKPAPRPSRSASTEFRLLGAGVGAILIGALALYAHIEVYRAGDDYTGALVFLDRLFDLGLVSSLAAVAFCSGRAICKRLCVGFENIAEETSFSVMSGFGTIALGVVALGLTGLLKPLPVTLLIVTLCAFGH